jgi:hypothetical protein
MKLTKDKLFSLLKNPKMWKNNDIQAECPICHKREFYIAIKDNHPFQCLRQKKCGFRGNIYTLLSNLGIKDDNTIKENVKWVSTLSNALEIRQEDDINIDLNEVKLPIGFRRVYFDSYLQERGFKEEDYNKYHIGITNLDRKLINYIIFVIYNDFKQVATIGRFKGTKQECELLKKPRYKNSESDFEKILGNYDDLEKDATETIILVEGFFDAKNISDLLNVEENQVNTKCCYTFKCHVSEGQLYKLKLKGIKNIILLYDLDVIDQIKEQAMILSKDFNVKIGFHEFKNEKGELKDAAELIQEEFIYILSTLINPLDFYTKKVQILNL